MSHVVIWLDSADDQLAAAYLAAQARGAAAAVTEAAARVESSLLLRASSLGESRGQHQRFVVVRPLAIRFEVHDEERVVVVTDVRYMPRRA
jgi:hypothetical protein